MRGISKLALVALAAQSFAKKCNPYVTSEELQKLIDIDDLLAGSQKLQDFADAHGGNRAFGSGGHNATVDWLFDTLVATGYYDVIKQPFAETFFAGSGSLSVNGQQRNATIMTYTASGTITGAPLVKVANFGCEVADFPTEAAGALVLILRGNCPFSQKATNAKTAGAAGAIVYNHEPGPISGTLGAIGDYVPIVGVSQEEGQTLVALLEAGSATGDLSVSAITERRVNFNVIAETKKGDHNNVLVLGGHSDSVAAGPGINDDGSGTIGVWAVAKALTNFRVKNAVRFAFWGAEEFGKLGSIYYMKQLNASETEVAKMRAYLNFDMIASPNYVLGIYDGDGSSFGVQGPLGSAQIEKEFEDFYKSKNKPFVGSQFTGRSDYLAFIENGVPSGGLFTGAEVVKTEFEAALFGGTAGISYDINYHKIGDDITNLAHDAYLLNTHSIANSVAKYAMSFDSLPPVDTAQRRWAADRAQMFTRDTESHAHSHSGPCGQGADLI